MSNNPIPSLLRARMTQLGLTQLEAARRAGLSRAGLTLLLTDQGNPALSTLRAIRESWPYPELFQDLDTFA